MELRKVIVSKMVRKELKAAPWYRYDSEPEGQAVFHQFGVNYEEFEGGPGNYTTAIVEWPDGRVESVPTALIQFVVPTGSPDELMPPMRAGHSEGE